MIYYYLVIFNAAVMGSVTKFEGFSLLCPNEREARLALQDKEIGLEQLSQRLLKVTS